jgi:hypothetical protein
MRKCAGNEGRVQFVVWWENIVVQIRRVINRLGTSPAVRYGSLGTLLLVVLALWGWISNGAEGGSYQAFALRHKKAAEVEPLLLPLLRNVTPPPHVIADSQNNQILLRGSDQAQQIVRQFLASVDRLPSPAATQPRATATPVVQGYPVARDQLAAVAARLETQLRAHPEARFTTDPDTSQVIVLAPPEVQALVAAELGQTQQIAPSDPGTRPWAVGLPATVPARPAVRSLQLTRVPLARLEVQVRQALAWNHARAAKAADRITYWREARGASSWSSTDRRTRSSWRAIRRWSTNLPISCRHSTQRNPFPGSPNRRRASSRCNERIPRKSNKQSMPCRRIPTPPHPLRNRHRATPAGTHRRIGRCVWFSLPNPPKRASPWRPTKRTCVGFLWRNKTPNPRGRKNACAN